ncbi:MAG TPA: DinB family protein [Bryobacteraceae bacterium]|jgi:uncharacterized damage-inducible protein DinB|nr:DinB family protein [Bryobacteraceae bacterium]
MSHKTAWIAAALLACAVALPAQDNPLSTETKGFYNSVKNNIIKAAEKMPAEQYAFKATPDVRSFGEIVGHIADSQFMFCSAVKGEEKKSDAEKMTGKAALVEALKASTAYCDEAYNSLTDADAATKVKFFNSQRTKFGILNINTAHDDEHYGNLVTYMRLKGLVPPSSEPRK